MTEEQINVGRLLGVDPERVHLRNKSVRLGGITREEFYGLVTKFEGTDYRLSTLKPGEPMVLCGGRRDTWDILFCLYQKGSMDAETILALVGDHERSKVPKFIWNMLAGDQR
jgi:hypothetical protein